MRRFIILLIIMFLAIQMLLLAGCAIPFFGRNDKEPPAATDENALISVDDGQKDNSENKSQSDGNWKGQVSSRDDKSGQDSNHSDEQSNWHSSGESTLGQGYAAESVTESAEWQEDVKGSQDLLDSMEADDAAEAAEMEKTQNSQSVGGLEEDNPQKLPEAAAVDNDSGVLAAQSNSGSSAFFSEPRRAVTVYYQDGDGCIVPMTRWIEMQPGIARASLSLVIDSALTREELVYYGVYPVLPENTEILGIDLRNGTAVIDFNRYLLNYDSALSERNIVASIVYTLTEFDTIEQVRILVNGYPQGILKYGTDLGKPLGRENVMINADVALTPVEMAKVDVFLMKQANIGFIYPVPVSLADATDADDMPEILVKQLLAAESRNGLVNEIPEGVTLLGVNVVNGTITLNFSEEFANYGGSAREEGILKQLAYTLGQCSGIRRIKLLISGRHAELPEGADISEGLVIPATINDVIDR